MKLSISKRYILLFIITSIVGFACLGIGDSPKFSELTDDSLPARFVREIGPSELLILMNDPNAVNNPGLPINEMLYLLDKISVDTMIQIVQGVGARKTADLMYALKRIGCNKTDPSLDIPFANRVTTCTTLTFNHLQLMVDLVNGVNDIQQMIDLIAKSSIDSNAGTTDDDFKKYLEKVAFLVIYLESTDKLLALINGVVDARDAVFFIDQFDPAMSLPPFGANIVTQIPQTNRVVSVLKQIADENKLYQLINGLRQNKGTAEDAAQMIYIRDKMKPVLDGPGYAAGSAADTIWIEKIVILINSISNVPNMVATINGITVAKIPSMVTLLDTINAPSAAAPANNAINTMAYLINNVGEPLKTSYLVNNIPTISNLVTLVNDVSTNSQLNDSGGADLTAAGQKLATVINGIALTSMYRMRDIVEYVNYPEKITELMNTMTIAGTPKLATLINSVTVWNENFVYASMNDDFLTSPTCPMNAGDIDSPTVPTAFNPVSDVPPMVALLNLLNGPAPICAIPYHNSINTMRYLLDNISDSSKLSSFIDNINTRTLAAFVNGVACVSQATDSAFPNVNNTDTGGDQICPDTSPLWPGRALVAGEGTDMNAAGKKLVNIMENVTNVNNLEYIMNNLDSSQVISMTTVVNTMSIGNGTTTGSVKVATLINNLSAIESTNTWNILWGPVGGALETAVNRNGALGMGKMVNMIQYIDDLVAVSTLIENINNAQLLAEVVARSSKSSNLIGLVNAIIADTSGFGVTTDDMVVLMNGLQLADASKMAALVNGLADAAGTTTTTPSVDHVVVAELLSPAQPNANAGGVGTADYATAGDGGPMALFLRSMSTTDTETITTTCPTPGSAAAANGLPDAAERAAAVIKCLNANVIYNSAVANIPKREALVRMLRSASGATVGFTLLAADTSNPTIPVVDVNFPGVGHAHLATIMNVATDASALIAAFNSGNTTDYVSLIGCTDHINEDEGPLNGGADPQGDNDTTPDDTLGPDFYTPCDLIGQGWVD